MTRWIGNSAWLALLAFCSLQPTGSCQQMPRFAGNPAVKEGEVVLPTGKEWYAGDPSAVVFMGVESISRNARTVNVTVLGDCPDPGATFEILCPNAAGRISLSLSELKPNNAVERCSDSLKLQVQRLMNTNAFKVTIAQSSRHQDTFRNKVDLQVNCRCGRTIIHSQSLVIYNLVAIMEVHETNRFLTSQAISFIPNVSASTEFATVDFVEPSVVRVIRQAPELIRNNLVIGASFSTSSINCGASNVENSVVLANSFVEIDTFSLQVRHAFLDISTGQLHFSTFHLSTLANQRIKTTAGRMETCVHVMCLGEVDFPLFSSTEPVGGKGSSTRPAVHGSPSRNCTMPLQVSSRNVTIFSGVGDTEMVCPIICNDKDAEFNFELNGRKLSKDCGLPWCSNDFLLVQKRGNVARVNRKVNLGALANVDSGVLGNLVCSAGGARFTFRLSFLALPTFRLPLPPRVLALEGESYSFACDAEFANLAGVNVRTEFWTLRSSTWQNLTDTEFNQLHEQKAGVTEKVNKSKVSTRAFVSVASVPAARDAISRNFTHRFVCRASVDVADAARLGLRHFEVQTAADVFFVRRPVQSSFTRSADCADGLQCRLDAGNSSAFVFEVAMKDDLVQQLAGAGVRVAGHFRLGRNRLSEFASLRHCERFIPSNNSVVFSTEKADDAAVKMLSSFGNLTAVYEFWYPKGSNLTNLNFTRNAAGNSIDQCARSSECFYSTIDDSRQELNFLTFNVEFIESEPAQPNTAQLGLVIGIVMALLILFLILVLIVFLLRRDPGQTYLLDEKERRQGNHPEQEVRDEVFKEYQRPEEAPLRTRLSLNSDVSAGSKDDMELNAYAEDIDYSKFREDGSFIGDYSSPDGAQSGRKN